MVLRQLEYLAALAREKHFGRAARACHGTQPTLSAAIRLLEDDLGAPIVERGHRFVGLTAQGRLVLEHAHRMLAEASIKKTTCFATCWEESFCRACTPICKRQKPSPLMGDGPPATFRPRL